MQFRSITIVVTFIALRARARSRRLSTRNPLIGSGVGLPRLRFARCSTAWIRKLVCTAYTAGAAVRALSCPRAKLRSQHNHRKSDGKFSFSKIQDLKRLSLSITLFLLQFICDDKLTYTLKIIHFNSQEKYTTRKIFTGTSEKSRWHKWKLMR